MTSKGRSTYYLAVPVLFMFFHQLVLNTVARLHFKAYLDRIDAARTLYDYADPAVVSTLQANADLQSYASLYLSLIAIPVYVVYLLFRHRQTKTMPMFEKVGFGDFAAGFSIMTGTLGIVTLWMLLLNLISERLVWLQALLDQYKNMASTLVPEDSYRFIVVFTLVLLVPIAEELLFRGIVQGELMRIMSEKWAILATLVLFSLFHLNPIQISYVILPAFVLSLVYALTKNLFVPIVMHIWFNLAGSGLLVGLSDDVERASVWLLFTELAFIAIGGMALIKLYRNKQFNTNKAEVVS